MNFSFLILIVLIILLYLSKQLKSKIQYYNYGIIFILFLLFAIYEIYMYIGNNKIENFKNIISNQFLLLSSQNTQENNVSSTTIIPNISSTTLKTYPCYKLINNDRFVFLADILVNSDESILSNKIKVFDINTEQISYKELKTYDNFLDNGYYDNRYLSSLCENEAIITISGGCNYKYNILSVSNKVSIYFKTWNIWKHHDLSKPRYLIHSVSDKTKFYFIFGLKENGEISKTIDVFNYSDSKKVTTPKLWSSFTVNFKPRIYMNTHIYNNKLYLIGGFDGEKYVNVINICYLDTMNWIEIPLTSFNDISSLNTELVGNNIYMYKSNTLPNKFEYDSMTLNMTDKIYNNEEIDILSTQKYKVMKDIMENFYKIKLDKWVYKLYEDNNLINKNENTSISFWINISSKNKDKTKIILADYKLCNNNETTEFDGLVLHNNRLLPCFLLNNKVLIKNSNVHEVKYDTWNHVVFNITYEPVKAPTVTPTETVTSTYCPEKLYELPKQPPNQSTTSINNTSPSPVYSHNLDIYLNTKETNYNLDFGIEYDEENNGLVISGFETFHGVKEFAEETFISNLKIFSPKKIQFPVIIELFNSEYNLYQDQISFELLKMDLVYNNFYDINVNIDTEYNFASESNNNDENIKNFDDMYTKNMFNIISQKYNNNKILFSIHQLIPEDNKINIIYYDFNCSNETGENLYDRETNYINLNSVLINNYVLFSGLSLTNNGNSAIEFDLINLTERITPNVIENIPNPEPKINKNLFYNLNQNYKTLLNKKYENHEEKKEELNLNIDNIKAIENNLKFVIDDYNEKYE